MEKLLEYLNQKRGRRTMLASQLGVSPAAISLWRRVPIDRVAEVSELTGISVHDLRPDVSRIFKKDAA